MKCFRKAPFSTFGGMCSLRVGREDRAGQGFA